MKEEPKASARDLKALKAAVAALQYANAAVVAQVDALSEANTALSESNTALEEQVTGLVEDKTMLQEDVAALMAAQMKLEEAGLIEDYFVDNSGEPLDVGLDGSDDIANEYDLVDPFCITGPSVLEFELTAIPPRRPGS